MADFPAEAFNQVPVNARPAGFYGEVVALSGVITLNQAALIVGQRLAAGTVAAATPTLIDGNGDQAKTYFGRGSQIAEMVAAFRQGNPVTELWAIALDDNVAGVAAAAALTVTGAATAAGTVSLYVGDVRVTAAVASGDAVAAVATSIADAVNANLDLPVTAAAALGVVTVTDRHKGEFGNDIALRLNVRGLLGGEALPAGIAIAGEGYLAAGAANPVQAAAIAAMGDKEYDFICLPYTDTTSLDAWDVEMESRWDAARQIYGLVFSARMGSANALNTFGIARNGKFMSVLETYDSPAAAYVRAARYTAQCSRALANHPARPLQTLKLTGEMAAGESSRFVWTDRNTLLHGGLSTTVTDPGGQVRIDRAITMYQTNAFGQADATWLDVTTPATLMRITRELRAIVETQYLARRCVLVDDGTPIAAGIPYASPSKVKASLVAHYDKLQLLGLAERKGAFEQLLIVSRDVNDPSRLNVRYTPDLANPLIVFAAQVGFSLQWPSEMLAVG